MAKETPAYNTMEALIERGYRPEGYRLPLWMDMSDALSPKEMAQAEKKWIKENPEKAKEWENRDALKERLKEKPGRMSGGGGGGLKPDTDITSTKKLPKMAKGGSVSSASKRADGCAIRGKTKGKMI